jgi:predicted ATPase
MKIESIRLKNYKAFQNITLTEMPSFMVVVGANGSGKSTLFDVFSFLHDCLKGSVRQALDSRGRFAEVISRNRDGDTILIEIQFRMMLVDVARLVTYTLEIGERSGSAYVHRESLRYKRGRHGAPFNFLDFKNGEGFAITNEQDFKIADKDLVREEQKVAPDQLAIKGLGQFQRFQAAHAFQKLIESWHVSDFHISAARERKDAAGLSEHLSKNGDNLPLVARYLHDSHPAAFDKILKAMTQRVPGIEQVKPVLSEDGYLSLRFKDRACDTPFYSKYVSDGTLKMFAYLVLLNDPSPHPLLCVEAPENQLYPALMVELAEEFRRYANPKMNPSGGQVLVSTHSPDFLNAAYLDEVYWLVKHHGSTKIKRAKDDAQLRAYMEGGDQMGGLWKQGFFEGADPA